MNRKSLTFLLLVTVLIFLPLTSSAAGVTIGAGTPAVETTDLAQARTDQKDRVTGTPAPAPAPAGALPSKLKIGIDAAYPPFERVDPNVAEIVGFDVDLMREIAKAGGFEVEFINTLWDWLFQGLDDGDYDAVISAVSITDERKLSFDFSEPYYAVYQALLVRKADAGRYKSLVDLKGRRVGAQFGTTGAIFVGNNPYVELVNYDDNSLAIEALLKGDIDAVVCDHPIAFDYALVDTTYYGKLTVANPRLNSISEPYGILVKKGNTKLLELINRGISGLDPGVVPRLEKKWNMR